MGKAIIFRLVLIAIPIFTVIGIDVILGYYQENYLLNLSTISIADVKIAM